MKKLTALALGLMIAPQSRASEAGSFFDLEAARLGGEVEKLSTYKGKVVLVVNTASECGFTPQYAGLQKLYEELAPKGFVVLGFPSNEFGGQEPGGAEEIRKFCDRRFHVTFPMFDKVKTKGEEASPVYRFLTRGQPEPKWNFYKYLVGKDGRVIDSYSSVVSPSSNTIRHDIEKALEAK